MSLTQNQRLPPKSRRSHDVRIWRNRSSWYSVIAWNRSWPGLILPAFRLRMMELGLSSFASESHVWRLIGLQERSFVQSDVPTEVRK